jgi:zinc transporter 9
LIPPCLLPPRFDLLSALLAEGLHSAADVANQLLLKQGVIRSRRKPTREHQYGFHKEKYVYALISGGCGW